MGVAVHPEQKNHIAQAINRKILVVQILLEQGLAESARNHGSAGGFYSRPARRTEEP